MVDLEANKRIVLEFYEHVVNRRDFSAAARYLGPYYIQHRADAKDGMGGLKEFIERMRQAYPHSRCQVKRVFADGDFVILHVHVVREPGTRGSAHVDLFRVEHGQVVEHWDVDEPIPASSTNSNSPI
jgi:predicted SnoaL-like aldol condensation-catalyzing enzyme